jgi:immune inhibitor A
MPAHPDLIDRIEGGEVERPFFFDDLDVLYERGINEPTTVEFIRELAAASVREDFNAIAILVDFDDNVSGTAPCYFDTLLYENRPLTLRNYWETATYGNLTIVTLDMPSALGWYRAPELYSYYTNGNYGFGSYPQNAQGLAEAAVELADPYVDFEPYDNDGDLYIEALFVIHAGPGAEFTGSVNDIWSHKWQLYSPLYVDGVLAYVYSMEPEYWQGCGDMTCGVYAHEMGHSVFGLPDLYDYDYDSRGVGTWSLMAGGSWNGHLGCSPAYPDAWCRTQTGAVDPIVLEENLIDAQIPPVQESPTIYQLWTEGQCGYQYFLVENRQKMGYDSCQPGRGLLIYHVDETQSGNDHQWYPGHTSYGNYLVAVEQADGLWQLEQNQSSGDAGDPYPGSTDNRIFDDESTPDSKDYDFNPTQVAVRDIGDPADTMTASLFVMDVCGDANGDGLVTVGDGYLILNCMGGGEIPVSCWSANVNGDDILTPGDGFALLNHLGNCRELDCAPCEFAGTLRKRIRAEE